MRRRITALILILVIIFTGLQGCSSKKSQKDNNTKELNQVQNSEKESGNKAKVKETAAVMGRYMEKEVKLPEFKENERVLKIIQGANNQIELYTHAKGEYLCYQLKEDLSWESSKPGWLNDGRLNDNNIEINKICYGADGCYYLCYADYGKEGLCNIVKSEDGGITAKDISIPYLNEKLPSGMGDKYYPNIRNMDVLENGNLVLSILQANNNLLIFSTKGDKIGEVSAFMPEDMVNYKATGNDIITADEEGKKIILYDTVNKKERTAVEYEIKNGSLAFAMNEEGTAYMVNSGGIHRLAKDGTLWETMVDGALNSMSMPYLYADSLIVTKENEEQYYVSYLNNNGEHILKHYVYDKNISSVPSNELTVYSLLENSTIRQAISLFQAQNADIKINYVVAMGEEGGTVSDYIRALNTELLAGSGADILVLDGLPVDSYLEKGVLTDLSDVILPREESGELMSNIADSFKTDGKIYQIPIRYSAPVLMGKQEVLATVSNTESIVNYIEKTPEVPYIRPMSYKYLLQNFIALYSEEIFNNGEISKEKLTTFLENVKKIADNSKAIETNEFDDGITKFDAGITNSSDDFINTRKLFITALGKITEDVSWFRIYDFFAAIMPFSIMKNTDLHYSSVNQRFIPSGLVGLNHASKEVDAAKQFIGFLFSEEVQNTNLYDGFPINNNAMKKWMDKENNSLFSASDMNGNQIAGTYPTREEREGILKLLKELKTPIVINQVITNIIIEEALPFFKGQIDANQAASAAYSKISTYMAE